jgi:hypothetical protein
MKLGFYVVKGLANGIENNASTVKESAISMMQNTIEAAKDVIDGNVDDDIVITPVMDLSNVQSGVSNISSLMGNVTGKEINVSTRLASGISSNNGKTESAKNQNGTSISNAGDTYNSTFNIVSNDPEEVANAVDIRMQKMRLQSNLAKGGSR